MKTNERDRLQTELSKIPNQVFADSGNTIRELAALYRRAVGSKDERLATTASNAAQLIAESESASVQAMHWRDIGLVASEPVGPALPGNITISDPSESAAFTQFVVAEGAAVKARYMRDFLAAALRNET